MKKFLSALVASVILLSCFSLALADDKIPTEDKPESITIDYSYNGVLDVEPYLTAFEEYFEATYGIPVTVNLQTAPDDIDVIKTAVAAGSGPDLWHMDVNYFSSFRGNVIQPLSTYLDDDIWAEYLDNGVGVWKYEDDCYALPVSFSVVGMLYNKTALEDAGITLGTTWTIDEFESALETAYACYKDKTVTYSDGNEYPYFMLSTQHTMYYWWLFYGVIRRNAHVRDKQPRPGGLRQRDHQDGGMALQGISVLRQRGRPGEYDHRLCQRRQHPVLAHRRLVHHGADPP